VAGNAARQRLLIAISHGVKRNIRCQKLKRNNTANEFYTVRKETLLPSGVQGGGAGEGRPTPYLKISGQTLFFRASSSCSKIPKDKKYFNTVKNFKANSVFQGKRRLFKSLKDKKYIFNTVNSMHIFFQGKHKLLKKPECKNYIRCSEIFQKNSVFRASASSSKFVISMQ